MQQTGGLWQGKRRYQAPLAAVMWIGGVDVIRTSGEAALSWGESWGEWKPSRPDTLIDEN